MIIKCPPQVPKPAQPTQQEVQSERRVPLCLLDRKSKEAPLLSRVWASICSFITENNLLHAPAGFACAWKSIFSRSDSHHHQPPWPLCSQALYPVNYFFSLAIAYRGLACLQDMYTKGSKHIMQPHCERS